MLYVPTPETTSQADTAAIYTTADLQYLDTPLGTLAVHAPRGGWAYVDADELALLRALAAGDALPASDDRAAKLAALWTRGLVAADGRWAREPGPSPAAGQEVFSLAMLLSTGCNLACTYCYLGHDNPAGWRHATRDEALAAIDAVRARGHAVTVVDLGEVAPIGDLWREIVLALRERPLEASRQLRVLVQTNATTLDEDDCAFCAAHGISVGVSLDGPAAVHDAARVFRDGRGSHARVTRVLGSLAAHGVPHWTIATVGRHNVELPEQVIEALAAFPAAPYALKPILPAGAAGADWETLGISAAAYAAFLRRAIRHGLTRDPPRLDLTSRQFLARILGRPDGWVKSCTSRRCGCGETRLVYEAGGHWTPCPRFGEYGVRTATPETIPALALPVWSRALPAACSACAWQSACGGGCALSGPDDPHCLAYRAHFEALFEDVLPAAAADPALGEAVFGGLELARG